jgi:hypothetical protein
MGTESIEYLPLVSDASASEDGYGQRKCRSTSRTFALREKLLVLVILLQAVALVASVLFGTRNTAVACQCPQSDRSLLYCESCLPGRDAIIS